MKFSQIEYVGAFSFAAGLLVLFMGLYVSSVKARIKEYSAREDKSLAMQVKQLGVIEEQAKIIGRFMHLEEVVNDLTRRVIKIEPS